MSTELSSTLDAFIATADEGSFSAAARRLGLTPAAVSKSVAQFEAIGIDVLGANEDWSLRGVVRGPTPRTACDERAKIAKSRD